MYHFIKHNWIILPRNAWPAATSTFSACTTVWGASTFAFPYWRSGFSICVPHSAKLNEFIKNISVNGVKMRE